MEPLITPDTDPLLHYRVTKLEEAFKVLSDGVSDIASTFKGAKWGLLVIFGIMQPVMIYVLTRGHH